MFRRPRGRLRLPHGKQKRRRYRGIRQHYRRHGYPPERSVRACPEYRGLCRTHRVRRRQAQRHPPQAHGCDENSRAGVGAEGWAEGGDTRLLWSLHNTNY